METEEPEIKKEELYREIFESRVLWLGMQTNAQKMLHLFKIQKFHWFHIL